jgi:uncharacterized protein YciI
MLFAVICNDKPGSLQLRMDTRPDHLTFLEKLNVDGTLVLAGPFLDSEGKPNGSLVVIDAPDHKAAELVAGQDPYAKAGLFASVEIRPWNWTFNKPETA